MEITIKSPKSYYLILKEITDLSEQQYMLKALQMTTDLSIYHYHRMRKLLSTSYYKAGVARNQMYQEGENV